MTHHSIMTYQERLATYIEALAREGNDLVLQGGQEQLSANMTSLFSAPASDPGSQNPTRHAALESLGRAAGVAAQVLVHTQFLSAVAEHQL